MLTTALYCDSGHGWLDTTLFIHDPPRELMGNRREKNQHEYKNAATRPFGIPSGPFCRFRQPPGDGARWRPEA